jgi:hypothetical protein
MLPSSQPGSVGSTAMASGFAAALHRRRQLHVVAD